MAELTPDSLQALETPGPLTERAFGTPDSIIAPSPIRQPDFNDDFGQTLTPPALPSAAPGYTPTPVTEPRSEQPPNPKNNGPLVETILDSFGPNVADEIPLGQSHDQILVV